MSALVFFLLALNIAIATWNCYVVGVSRQVVRAQGGAFLRFVLWSAKFQAGIGFSMPLLILFAFLATAWLTTGEEPKLTPEEAKQFMKAIFDLWYVAIIIPLLGTGLAITIHSVKSALERRDFASVGSAVYNVGAQLHNTWGAIQHTGEAASEVGEFVSETLSKSRDGRVFILFLLLAAVAFSLIGGFMIATWLTNCFERNFSEAPIQTRRYRRA